MRPIESKPDVDTHQNSNALSIATSIVPIPISIPDQLLPFHQMEAQQVSSLSLRSFEEISKLVTQTTFSMTNLNIDEKHELETGENLHMTSFVSKRDEMNALTVCISKFNLKNYEI